MRFINHRINTISELQKVPISNGVELDIRYHNNRLILHHDPFGHHEDTPEDLELFLNKWHHSGPMILNIKTEGIELKCIELMEQYEIKNWFFLDMSMPYFAAYAPKAAAGELKGFSSNNIAVRFSEREPIEYALAFAGQVGWVWVDCFTKLPLNSRNYNQLKEADFKICLVSPELQNHPLTLIKQFRDQCRLFEIDAVCTKRTDLWGQKLHYSK